jgi:phytanoyl-CoA hydroxylase
MGMTIMKDVSIVKSEFVKGEGAVNKIQDYQYDETLFKYCCLAEVSSEIQLFFFHVFCILVVISKFSGSVP